MKIINDINNQTIYDAICNLYRRKPDENMHVTELIDSPHIRYLRIKHWDDIEVPASKQIFALRGTLFHYLLRDNCPADAIPELTMYHHKDGINITGTMDLWYPDQGIIDDYKETSLWSYIYGKESWELQLNVYCWMVRHNWPDKPVTQLRSWLLLREWNSMSAFTKSDYPQTPFQLIKQPVWDFDDQESFVELRLIDHSTRHDRCTNEERWQRDESYAVKMTGRKTALRVLNTQAEAEAYMTKNKLKNPPHYIEVRLGSFARCQHYCEVAPFCEQLRKEKRYEVEENPGTDHLAS